MAKRRIATKPVDVILSLNQAVAANGAGEGRSDMRSARGLMTIGLLAFLAGIGLASGANAQSIMVTSPNGGETWAAGTAQSITWSSTDVTGKVRFILYGNWTKVRVLGTVLASAGTWTWNIPADEPARTNARIRVQSLTDTAVSDYGNGLFTIGSPTLTVTSPNGGESLGRGLKHTISWNNTGVTGNVTIYLYNNWTKLRVLGTPAASAGSWTWTIPAGETVASTYRIRVQSNENTAITDYGNALFSIVDATLTLTSPNGGEEWVRNSTHDIAWTGTALGGDLDIWLYNNWTKLRKLATVPAQDGSWSWTIPQDEVLRATCRARVSSSTLSALSDYSDAVFAISEVTETFLLPGDVPLTMVWIPGGSFWMGRYSGEQGSGFEEDPQHQVTLSGFWIGKYEVTKAQWTAIMGTTPWKNQSCVLDAPNSPAVYVSWDDAQSFVTGLNTHTGETFKLPSESQWEYACRGGTATRFYWGDDASHTVGNDYAWWTYNASGVGEEYAHAVGLKLKNACGLYDMSGNAWEWCQDWYHSSYSGAPADGSAWESPAGSYRIVRGGTWFKYDGSCRSAFRYGFAPSGGVSGEVGFRLAR